MDKLNLTVIDLEEEGYSFQSVSISINGEDLIEMLRKYELPMAGAAGIAGGYSGIAPEVLFVRLANPKNDLGDDGWVPILECECHVEGCWPMKVKITDLGETVKWSDFQQPHRSGESGTFWDYSRFGPFVFKKNDYLKEVEKLGLLVHETWLLLKAGNTALHPKKIENIIELDPEDRYWYTIREIIKLGSVWVVFQSDSLVTIVGPEGDEELPIWPHKEVADRCVLEEMRKNSYLIEEIGLKEFLEVCLADMENEGIMIGVFYDRGRKAIVVPGQELRSDIEEEIESYAGNGLMENF